MPNAAPLLDVPDVPAALAAELADRFVLDAKIGEGGMGVVYSGRHTTLQRPVAVKVLRPKVSQDPTLLERFRREALSAARVDSPHVVQVFDFGRLADGSAYIVMELLDGHQLGALIEEVGALSWVRACRIALQLCDVLGKAHEAGIVHRDLKPENVILLGEGDDERVKVVDFGIAKLEGEAALTKAGRAIGTPDYMSPEQCEGARPDGRADLYSLGVMLFEMVSDSLPFEYDMLPRMLIAHMTEAPPRIHDRVADLPEGLGDVIMRCLEKDRDDRYASMADLADALRRVLQGEVSEVRAVARRVDEISNDGPTVMDVAPEVVAAAVARGAVDEGATTELPARARAESGVVSKVPRPAPRRTWVPLAVGAGLGALVLAGAGVAILGALSEDPSAVTQAVSVAPAMTEAPEGAAQPAPIVAEEAPAPTPQAGPIRLTSDPLGALVLIDGAEVGDTPLAIARPNGEPVRVRVLLEGYQPREVLVGGDAREQIRLSLSPVAPAAPITSAPARPAAVSPPPAAPSTERHSETPDNPFADPPPAPSGPGRNPAADQVFNPWG